MFAKKYEGVWGFGERGLTVLPIALMLLQQSSVCSFGTSGETWRKLRPCIFNFTLHAMLFTGIQCKHGPLQKLETILSFSCYVADCRCMTGRTSARGGGCKRSTVGNKFLCFFPSSILVPNSISNVLLFDLSQPWQCYKPVVPWGLRGNNVSILQSFCFCHQLCTVGLFDRDVQPVSNTTEDMRSDLVHQISETGHSLSSFSAFFWGATQSDRLRHLAFA